MARMTPTTPERSETSAHFIKLPAVRSLTTLSTSEIYRRIAAGTFPKQVLLGPGSTPLTRTFSSKLTPS
ncbi:TPA: AlpA family phage regulatory protein [Pseudomonas aeruginosa]|nr:AlpA family phage regulatory protein [Pseudomonas aeruginosa]